MSATVLVVDDSPIDRRLVGALLTKRGFEVSFAVDGLDALDKIASSRPDVVVTDLQMPGISGLELVEKIKLAQPSLPVVLITAHGSEHVAVEALRAGAASYVTKRRLAQELAETVSAIVALLKETERASLVDPLEVREVIYTLGANMDAIAGVLGELEVQLAQLGICDQSAALQVAVALREAIVNAVVHGNLEVSSELLEGSGKDFGELIEKRRNVEPYRSRQVHILARYQRSQAEYTIADEGPGFDPTTLPDPTDLANLEKASGRGLMLIRMFMDEVTFNERGNEIRMVKRRPVTFPAAS